MYIKYIIKKVNCKDWNTILKLSFYKLSLYRQFEINKKS